MVTSGLRVTLCEVTSIVLHHQVGERGWGGEARVTLDELPKKPKPGCAAHPKCWTYLKVCSFASGILVRLAKYSLSCPFQELIIFERPVARRFNDVRGTAELGVFLSMINPHSLVPSAIASDTPLKRSRRLFINNEGGRRHG